MTTTEPRLVKVVWDDAASPSEWTEKTDIDLARVESVGWLVIDRPDKIVIASGRNVDGHQWDHLTVIPRGGVVKIIDLGTI